MWLDLIIGQGDRHWENYFVHIDKNTHAVTVNAIDKDASFTVRQIGIQKYALDKDTAAKFLAELKKECNELYGAEAGQKEYDARVSKDLGINSLEIADLFQICEDTFGIVIDDEEVNDFVTVGDIVNYLESKKG